MQHDFGNIGVVGMGADFVAAVAASGETDGNIAFQQQLDGLD